MNHNERLIQNEGGNYSGNMAEQEYDRWLDDKRLDRAEEEEREMEAFLDTVCKLVEDKEIVKVNGLKLK